MRRTRSTSRGIVLHEGNILLIERWWNDQHYFSIPGGGIEANETPEQTVVREIKEETSLTVIASRLLYEQRDEQSTHYFYLCDYIDGTPHLPDISEEAQAGPDNRFKPQWINLEKLEKLPFMYWKPVQKLLLNDLKSGFEKSVKITAAYNE